MAVKFKNYTKSGSGGSREPRSAKNAAKRTVSKSFERVRSRARRSADRVA